MGKTGGAYFNWAGMRAATFIEYLAYRFLKKGFKERFVPEYRGDAVCF